MENGRKYVDAFTFWDDMFYIAPGIPVTKDSCALHTQ